MNVLCGYIMLLNRFEMKQIFPLENERKNTDIFIIWAIKSNIEELDEKHMYIMIWEYDI